MYPRYVSKTTLGFAENKLVYKLEQANLQVNKSVLIFHAMTGKPAPLLVLPPPPGTPKLYLPLSLKCSILHNVASGLSYLHQRSPPIIHRDLSARNVLLNSRMVAKIVDLGVARIVPRMRAAATMTKGPGALVYMPPEATAPAQSNTEKSKYDASIDIFSLGVIAIFTISEIFPCDPLAHNYVDEKTGALLARTELQRRSEYMQCVNDQLHASDQLCENHPLLQLIQQCLQNLPTKRPGIYEVLCLLEEARAGARDREWEEAQVADTQPENQSVERYLQSRVQQLQQQLQSRDRENADLQLCVEDLRDRLHSSNQEYMAKDSELAQVRQQLRWKEAELTRADEAISRQQQQLRQKIEEFQSNRHQLQSIEVEKETMKQQLQSIELEKETIKQQLQSMEVEKETIKQQLQSTEVEKETMKQKFRSTEVEKEIIKQQVRSSVWDIEIVKEQLESSEREKEKIKQKFETSEWEIDIIRQQLQTSEREKNTIEHQLQSSDREKESVRQQLQSCEREKQALRQQLMRQLAETQQQLAQREEQLRSSEALLANFQMAFQERDSESQRTKPQHSVLTKAVSRSLPPAVPRSRRLTLMCRQKKAAPYYVLARGSATSDGKFAYFTPLDCNYVYRYEWSREKWETLPSCPYKNSGLVIIDCKLVAVGGWDGSQSNKLLTLQQNKWVMELPSMNNARSKAAVVTTFDGDYLLVMGGYGVSACWTGIVELFQVKSRRWYKLTALPLELTGPSATICGTQVHVIGIHGEGYSCSLQDLPTSNKPIPSHSVPQLSWKRLPPLPVTHTTPATLCGQQVIIGGLQERSLVNCIYQLVDGQWVQVGCMATGRSLCLVASPSPDTIMAVGGVGAQRQWLHCVEEYVVV